MIFPILLLILCSIALGQQEGWRMVDRFYGFRFETSSFSNDDIEIVEKAAINYGCFGWIQNSKSSTLVGEIRCAKEKGIWFHNWLKKDLWPSSNIKVYEDTKIKLHFSYFKVLPPEKDTCFLDAPHQCQI